MGLDGDKELLLREMRKASKSSRIYSESDYSAAVLERLRGRLADLARAPGGVGLLFGCASPAVLYGGKSEETFPARCLKWRLVRRDRLEFGGGALYAADGGNRIDWSLTEPVAVAVKRVAALKAGLPLDSLVEQTVESLVGEVAVQRAESMQALCLEDLQVADKWFSDMRAQIAGGKVQEVSKRFAKKAPGWIDAARAAFKKTCVTDDALETYIKKGVQRRLDRLAEGFPESISHVRVKMCARSLHEQEMDKAGLGKGVIRYMGVEMSLLMKSGGRKSVEFEAGFRAGGFSGLMDAALLRVQASPIGFVQRNVDRVFKTALKGLARSVMGLGLENIDGDLGAIFVSETEKEILGKAVEPSSKGSPGPRKGL